MKKYFAKRILGGLISAILTVILVMGIIYGTLDRSLIFATDTIYAKLSGNQKTFYTYQVWENYGYLDLVSYSDYLMEQLDNGDITKSQYYNFIVIGKNEESDTKEVSEKITDFKKLYTDKGYTIVRLNAQTDFKGNYSNGGKEQLFAYKDISVPSMIARYFGSLIKIDTVNSVKGNVGVRKLTFTMFDPVYGGDKVSPAIIGNGTNHKYLLYFDSYFPYIHQNFITINLGKSYSVNKNKDVSDTMTKSQGVNVMKMVTYPTGYTEVSADDLHSAIYIENSKNSLDFYSLRYTDDYTGVETNKNAMSRLGYSFVIGIIAVLISYIVSLPLSTYMAMGNSKIADLLGTIYIAFMTAVPALAYIFMFKALGSLFGIPVSFNVEAPKFSMLIMPIISISLPQIANTMKWNRRYAKDLMNSDYVEFAKSLGFNNWEILKKYVSKNAVIPIVHGIPGAFLGALSGAIITERVYQIPGVGNLFTGAINSYDNSVIVGLTLFYALVSVVSVILGDYFMMLADPRITLYEERLK